jgi:putative ABC transport system permease protein
MPSVVSGSTLTEVLETLGAVNEEKPTAIHIYAVNFEDKDTISEKIAEYNKSVPEDDQITYTDYMAILMSGITSIIDAISYGLIAFVAVSLVVSSIMIGIITYISVLERTKEIGVLRAIGASKKDVSLVFNAETLIIGFAAGLIGIGSSILLCIPINWIVHMLTGITAINAFLPTKAAIMLVLISMGLTLFAGLFPASMAARKDPVEALRTE